ncbi:hypothetical protein [Ktedonobacter racemifer]|uniref:Uncharacterized protein n=1 Tax=Ktedonobacter racemifer DSM 44963 TaxID=485913 RepID=D6U2U7_KTERA|nr:hypothetical protein [Ktedonobacter racemifer]EFH82852.1 hypothetical protein Krac_3715 [Ktedonobacter racemifer DSM 44963]
MQLNEDEAGPYQAIPQPGASWQPEDHPLLHPHEYERGGTAKLLTLFRPTTGLLRAKGVVSATNAVLHPWLKEQLSEVLDELEKKQPAETLPPEAERAHYAQWKTWLTQHSCEESTDKSHLLLFSTRSFVHTQDSLPQKSLAFRYTPDCATEETLLNVSSPRQQAA